jgi:hypothetical protein
MMFFARTTDRSGTGFQEARISTLSGEADMKSLRFTVLALAAALAASTGARADDQKPIRRLVYNFDVTLSSNLEQQGYSGTSHANGSEGDRGQILVDVLAVQPDTGLVVRISENARNTRSAEPAMCVTYGNGQFICETGKKINEEEYTLLRLIGKNFVNTAQIDAKNHWSYATSSPDMDEKSDYTINSNKNDVLAISLLRVMTAKGAQGYTATTEGQVEYNQKLSVPVSDTEDTITRYDNVQIYNRLEAKIRLNLASDSMAAQTASH